MKLYNKNFLKHVSASDTISFFLVILMMFFFSLLEVISISTIPLFANLFFKKDYGSFIDEKYLFILENINSIEILSILIISIFIFKNLFGLFINFTQFSIVKKLLIKISTKLYSNILNRNFLYFVNSDSSLIVRNLTHEIDQLGAYINALFVLIKDILLIIFFIILIILSGYFYAFSYIVFIGLILLVFFKIYKKKIYNISLSYQSLKGSQIKKIGDTKSLIQEIKIYNLFNFYNLSFKTLQNQIEHYKLLKNLIVSVPRFVIEILFIVSIITLIYISSKFYNDEEIFGLIIFVSVISIRFIPLYGSLSSSIMSMKTNYPSINLILKELRIRDLKIDHLKIKKKEIKNNKNFLEIKNLEFKYKKNLEKVINKINFKIVKNDFIGIVGSSGSGKTTFVNILCGLIYPDKGSFYSYGKNIYRDLNNWQSKIGYVSSTSLVLNESIIKNITLDQKPNKRKIIKILKQLKLENLINKLNFKVGDSGGRLSSGQRQRLLIARVIYRNPEILIFDEVTNYLDSTNEEKVLKLIKSLNKTKPVILITHKKSNLKYCNKIIKF